MLLIAPEEALTILRDYGWRPMVTANTLEDTPEELIQYLNQRIHAAFKPHTLMPLAT